MNEKKTLNKRMMLNDWFKNLIRIHFEKFFSLRSKGSIPVAAAALHCHHIIQT